LKKMLSFALIAALLLALFACGKAPVPIPNPPLVLGEKYLSDLDYEQALLQFDQAIEIEPKNPRGYLGKADALLHLERQADADAALGDGAKQCRSQRATLNEARAAVTKSLVDGYIALSSAYEKLGWREIALALLKRVCEELPEESRLREALERLLSGDKGEEEADVTEEFRLTPPMKWWKESNYNADGTYSFCTTNEVVDNEQCRRIRYSEDGQEIDNYLCSIYDPPDCFRSKSFNGKILKEIRWCIWGQKIEWELGFIDSDGSLVSVSDDDILALSADGKTITRTHPNSSLYADWHNMYTFNSDGILIKDTWSSISGEGPSSTTEYNENGQAIKSTDGHFLTTWEYNAEGWLTRANSYSDGRLWFYEVYEYEKW